MVQRLSGGGAVYHDRGNLNFTFVARDCQGGMIDFSSFAGRWSTPCGDIKVPAPINGRNDMTIGDKSFPETPNICGRAGSCITVPDVRLDLEAVGQVLAVRPDNSVQGFEIGAQPGHQQALCK